MIERVPEPDTEVAQLWSDGVNQPTWHDYVETRPGHIEASKDSAVWEFMFKCRVTGKLRRWGCVPRRGK